MAELPGKDRRIQILYLKKNSEFASMDNGVTLLDTASPEDVRR
ncbi:MAG: hypothetical protein RH862_14285 [Leptospiraceae bacterium]